GFFHDGEPVTQEWGKMGKSLKNAVSPDEMYDSYGADTLRLYEMAMGPLDQSRPWETRDVVGMYRFLQRLWRNAVDEDTGELSITEAAPDEATLRALHRTIDAVTTEMSNLRFNTAIAKLIELNNDVTKLDAVPRSVLEPMVLMLAPLAPHLCEELWNRLGHHDTLTYEPFPVADPAMLIDELIEYPVQVNGKVRGRITVAADADQGTIETAALAEENVARTLADGTPKKIIVIPGRMVNIVA
ncbi:MAG: class I tRNA ligase family protein, partial [Acidimicrobiales bacterium]